MLRFSPLRPPSALSILLACGALGWLVGCGGGSAAPLPDAGLPPGIHASFEPSAAPMAFGAIPWPDDLYLDASGHISVGKLPGEDQGVASYFDGLRKGLATLDGFGALSPAFFEFEGDIDPTLLPATPAASTREDASAFVMDVDTASPSAFERVPVDATWRASAREVALRPADGHPLVEGRRYAAVITRAVLDAQGHPLSPSPAFAMVRDATTRPSDPLLAAAWDEYSPVLASLASNGVPRDTVVALAVFHVQTIGTDLDDAHTLVHSGSPPVASLVTAIPAGAPLDAILGTPAEQVAGLDVPGGVLHQDIGWMIQGTFPSPGLLDAQPRVHGRFERDASGALKVKRTETVPFTLWLPSTGDLHAVPIVLFQHGLGDDRSEAMAVADGFARDGWAVLAIDAPWHGQRNSRGVDLTNRFTGAHTPDGFGDATGAAVVVDFAGVQDTQGELNDFHPIYLRDALRQSAVDLMMATRLIEEGDWSAVQAADPALAGLGFASGPIGFMGYSLGGIIGTLFVAEEPDVGAAVLAVTGGNIMRLVAQSPPFNQGYFPLLLPLMGMSPDDIDWATAPASAWPQIALWQTMLDQGDPVAYAPRMQKDPCDVLMMMAHDDETLNNVATESLARTVGAVMVGGDARYTDLPTQAAPVRGNFAVAGTMVTRALYVWQPATHLMMISRHAMQNYVHPVAAPFQTLPAPTPVDNPVDAAIGQTLHFFESWRSGAAELAAPGPT